MNKLIRYSVAKSVDAQKRFSFQHERTVVAKAVMVFTKVIESLGMISNLSTI